MSSTFDLFAAKLNVTREQLLDALTEHVHIGIDEQTDLFHPEDVDCVGKSMITNTRYQTDEPNTIIVGVGDPTDPRQRAVKLVKVTVTPIDEPVKS